MITTHVQAQSFGAPVKTNTTELPIAPVKRSTDI